MDRLEVESGLGKLLTPCYVFDADVFRARIREIREVLADTAELCFAMKANPFIAEDTDDIRIEVCSFGELAICERADVDMRRIVLSGVNKDPKETERVIRTYGEKVIYTAESPSQLELISGCARSCGKKLRVLLRLTAGNQFGMDRETIEKILSKRDGYILTEFLGIQFYSGTQKRKLSLIEKELDMLDEFLEDLREKYGYEARELEYGPGLYVPYFLGEEPENTGQSLGKLRELLLKMKFKGRITLEMGRYLAASCGYYFTKIVDEKVNSGQQYAIADGGIHQLNYYGQMMAMKIPHYTQYPSDSGSEEGKVTLCGSLCTVNDILVRNIPLSIPAKDSVIAFENCGAYSATEGMALFLSRDLPRIYKYKEGHYDLIRDRFESNVLNSRNI
ncbi:MAG: diaminopimelate decarboxylase family protein [Lachnospiraceae bacterium]|jgi:diaminopimelate decarboxylase